MATRKISVNEVTNYQPPAQHGTVTCTSPAHTPLQAGNHSFAVVYNCNYDFTTSPPQITFQYDVQMEYLYLNHGATFSDFCDVFGSYGSVPLPTGSTLCTNSSTILASITVPTNSITTTVTSVSGSFIATFTATNLCSQTFICLNDVPCQI
jgi:hypothetical protein